MAVLLHYTGIQYSAGCEPDSALSRTRAMLPTVRELSAAMDKLFSEPALVAQQLFTTVPASIVCASDCAWREGCVSGCRQCEHSR